MARAGDLIRASSRRMVAAAVAGGVLLGAAGIGTFGVAFAGPNDGGSAFEPLPPVRILDTRTGNGAVASPLGPEQSIDLQVTGRGGVPSTATAVVLNVTVTDPSASSFLTLWPTGETRPNASNLNWVAGRTIPNLVTVKLGAGGRVSIYNFAGTTHVLADVAGYFYGATYDDRYYTKPQIDSAFAAAAAADAQRYTKAEVDTLIAGVSAGTSALRSGPGAPGPSVGNNGDFYVDTVNNRFYGPKAAGVWPTTFVSIIGPTGPAGAKGDKGDKGDPGTNGTNGTSVTAYTGTTVPAAGLGAVGDLYVRRSGVAPSQIVELYGPKTASGWGTGVSLVGPAGPAGPAGQNGVVGTPTYVSGVASAACPAGTVLVGGSYVGPATDVVMTTASYSAPGATKVVAVCVTSAPS